MLKAVVAIATQLVLWQAGAEVGQSVLLALEEYRSLAFSSSCESPHAQSFGCQLLLLPISTRCALLRA
jgi:hypothetical protein